MRLFGLIGYPLGHSFSKKYFTEKFEREGIRSCKYELFEIEDVHELPGILQNNTNLVGLNVTIPHKQAVIPLLDDLDSSARKVGAVNVIHLYQDKLIGHNSDYFGFRDTLVEWLPENQAFSALVLGTGGASKAVRAVLTDLEIPYTLVSRTATEDQISYRDIQALDNWNLIINTTPLGMHPATEKAPEIPYQSLSSRHYLYDLVYNPGQTLFLKKGKEHGSKVMNGLGMLYRQAEKAWDIWNR